MKTDPKNGKYRTLKVPLSLSLTHTHQRSISSHVQPSEKDTSCPPNCQSTEEQELHEVFA